MSPLRNHAPVRTDWLANGLRALTALLLLLLFLHAHGWAQGIKPTVSGGSSSTSIAVNDGTTTTQKATVDASGNLHVNCASGCAGGSSTPADGFATPATAGLSLVFPELWNGVSFDRWYGDKSNGAWVNIKTSASIPVTGTFWQATQPVSGTFFQATQPVSIATMPSTPVTGTFFQATQPVSIASMPSTPVTGTFFQATQPVSGTVTSNQGSANTVGNAWPAKLTDGTNTAAVKAASTAAAATDPAIVVNLSPNVADPCASPAVAKNSVAVNASGTTAAQIIALSGSTLIYVCHYTIVGGGTSPTWVLEYGTGTNCATGATTLNTAFAIPTTPFTVGWGGTIHKTAAGNALCTLLAGTSPTAKGYLTYVQQ